MTLLADILKMSKSKVNEMDFEFGGVKPQPAVTDGPPPPEDDGYKDFDTANGDDHEYDDPLAGEDKLEMEIPFLIKLLEWAHEEAQSDEDIHKMAENLLALDKSPLTMDDYEEAVAGFNGGEEGMGDGMGGDGGGDTTTDMNGDIPPRNADTTQNGAASVFRMS